MTKVSLACLAGMLFFASCENNNSSTVGTYEQDESPVTSEKEHSSKEGESIKHENVRDISMDTAKSSDSSLHKKDTGILINKKSIKMQSRTKKVNAKQ